MLSARVDELINAILDGEASRADVAELQSLIGDDAALAAQLADRIAEHRLLGVIHQPFDSPRCVDAVLDAVAQEERSVADAIVGKIPDAAEHQREVTTPDRGLNSRRARQRTGMFTTALAMLLLVAAGAWFLLEMAGNRHLDSTPVASAPHAASQAALATLLLEENCRWTSGAAAGEGQRLAPGRVDLESGTAVLRFDGGAELVMVGPAAIDLQSAVRVLVQFGDVVVRATEGAEGFVVTTPTSEVVDLGTEFAVRVSRDGQTEVHVLEGEVSYRQIDAPPELVKILHVGEGVAIDKNGRPRAVAMNSPRFKDYLRKMNPRSRVDLLTAYDGFNYSPGVLPLEQSTVGIGWAGPWRRRSRAEQTLPADDASPDRLEIVHGQLNVTWPVPGGRMGMLKLPARSVYYVRPLKQSIKLDEDSVTYFSLMVRETQRVRGRTRPRERVRFTLRSLEDYYGQYISFGHGSGYQPRVQTGDGVLHSSPMVLPPEQTTLWIGKIVARAHGEDEISFRVYGEDDALGYAEPATWHVVTRGVDLDSHLDCVLLSSEGTTERLVDELRIGRTWRSVAPMQEATE